MFNTEKDSGYAWVSKKLSDERGNFMPNKESFQGNLVKVIERNSDGDCLCILNDDTMGMADIRSEDIILFIPINKSDLGGLQYIYPNNLNNIQQINWSSLAFEYNDIFNACFIYFSTINDRCATNEDYKEISKLCQNSNNIVEIKYIVELMKRFKQNPNNFKKPF